jgi:hypothetical protein
MLSLRVAGRLLAIVAVALLSAAVAHAAAPDNRIDHLVVGDCYWLQVERHGVRQELSGDLVKVTDRWIVLHGLSEGRNEHGVLLPSSIPFINPKFFRNVGIGRANVYTWVPRDGVVIRGRLKATDPPTAEPPRDDEPIQGAACEVKFVGADKKVVEQEGKLKEMSDDRLTLSETEAFRVDVPKPGWSKLPWVGGYFIESRTETREKLTEIARGDIFCIRIAVAQRATPVPDKQVSMRQ